MCRECGGEAVKLHCDSGRCGWVVCLEKTCGSTSDATRTEPWFFPRKSRRAKRS